MKTSQGLPEATMTTRNAWHMQTQGHVFMFHSESGNAREGEASFHLGQEYGSTEGAGGIKETVTEYISKWGTHTLFLENIVWTGLLKNRINQ